MIYRNHLLLIINLLSISLATAVYAVPASPDPVELQQPDGSRIISRLRGDEFQNWHESEESGHTIVKNRSTGYWEYAEKARDGSLRGSGIHVLPHGLNAPASIPKRLKPLRNTDNEKRLQQMLQESYQQRLDSGTTVVPSGAQAAVGDWIPLPVSGPRNLLIILVSFADRAVTTLPSDWSTMVFDETAKSVAKYYKENSFNSLSIAPVTHTQTGNPAGVVSVTLPSNHPNTGGSYTFPSDQAWGNSALQQAGQYVDFNSLDSNANGKLETAEAVIYFIAAGYEASAGSGLTPSVWAHAWWTSGTGLTAGTKNVQRWALNGEYHNTTTQMTMGVIAHELGHQMCGLPDLYDISGNNSGMGDFSLMAGGSWGGDSGETGGATPVTLDAWSREFLGWATPATPGVAGLISFSSPLASTSAASKLYLPPTSTSEYFLVENRYPSNWDLGLKRRLGSGWQGGLLITHIDTTAGTLGNNDINSYSATVTTPGHQGVVPVQASTTVCNLLTVGTTCRGHATTLYYSGNNPSWTPLSVPSSSYYNGVPTNLSLSAISAPGSTMTAELAFSSIPGPPTGVTAIAGFTTASVSFTAPAVDGGSTITSYSVISNPGGLTGTGTASPLTVTGLSNGTAYTFNVRASNALGTGPESTTSNSVTPFVPIKIMNSGYATIATAYPEITADGLLLLRDLTFNENVDFNRPVAFTLKGGYDLNFTANNGTSTINGTMTVTDGTLTMDNITLR